MEEVLLLKSHLEKIKIKAKDHFNATSYCSSEAKASLEETHGNGVQESFYEMLRSLSLSELVRFKLEVFFYQQNKAQVRVDGLHSFIMEQVEKPLIELSLRKFGGNQLRAAKMLGINRNTLKRKIRFYKVDVKDVKRFKK